MSPATRTLIRVTVAEDEGETAGLVERLMGKRPELRFQYIQENARFVEDWTSDRTARIAAFPPCAWHVDAYARSVTPPYASSRATSASAARSWLTK